MKRTLLVLFTAGILVSCNTEDRNVVSPAIEKEHESHSDKENGELALNNGNKWKADTTTNNNVKALLVIVDEFNSGKDKTLINYHTAAAGLQIGLEKMIKECRMQGEDHDALHKWLEPLMKQVSSFQKATTEEQAEEQVHNIHGQLNLYEKYFE